MGGHEFLKSAPKIKNHVLFCDGILSVSEGFDTMIKKSKMGKNKGCETFFTGL